MARGKKPTVSQANLLREKGLNPRDWMYVREETVSPDGGKLSRNAAKERFMIFERRNSCEKRRIPV